MNKRCRFAASVTGLAFGTLSAAAWSEVPFATTVIDYSPAPGQFVNLPMFNVPAKALGPPHGGGTQAPDQTSIVSLGGFGGSITLGFNRTVMDAPANPLGLDAIVFGNALWVSGHHNRHLAEAGTIEICRDLNDNGQPDVDEPWYLIPGSHMTNPSSQWSTQTWDDNVANAAFPPSDAAWIPPGATGTWQTSAFRLPSAVFELSVVTNPNGLNSTVEGIFGYADFSPTRILGDVDGDNFVDDPTIAPADFYTIPDDPLTVGIDAGCGGGDAFDIAWAIDPDTGEPAQLDGFDFIRVTTAVNRVLPPLGELSTEIDAVADVAPGLMGDTDADGDVDLFDFVVFAHCANESAGTAFPRQCRIADFDMDSDVDLIDFAAWQMAFTGEP